MSGLIEEIGVGAVRRPPDATAQLVELGQTERVGVVDDDGIDVRDIDAGLDDRRRDQNVEVLAHEAEHDLLEHLLVHLAVTDAEARLRHELAQLVGQAIDVVDAVVDEVDLAAAVDLAQDHLADQLILGRGDERPDRQPGLRRGVDHADVADAGQRHVQRARDRGRAHRQHVDLGPQLLEELLLANAEALLLVDDDQTRDS